MNPLIGKKPVKAYISADRTLIRLQCDDGSTIDLTAEGDCCSESWIEHIAGLDSLLGSTVTSVDTVEIGEVIPTRQNHDLLYAMKIVHTAEYGWQRIFDIEFRNSSNGYTAAGSTSVRDAERSKTSWS